MAMSDMMILLLFPMLLTHMAVANPTTTTTTTSTASTTTIISTLTSTTSTLHGNININGESVNETHTDITYTDTNGANETDASSKVPECVHRQKRDLLKTAAELQMLLNLREQSKKRNMLEGELEEYLLDTQVSEFEIYQIYESGMPEDVNFTVIKGEIKYSNFSYALQNEGSQDFNDLKQQFADALLELNENSTINLSVVDLETMNIHFDRTDDCRTTFLLTLPWVQPLDTGSVHLEEAVEDHISYHGHLGSVSISNAVVKDFCKVRVRDTAFKVTIVLTGIRLSQSPQLQNILKDNLLSILRSFFRNKFGELFYRIIIMSFENNLKGLVVETAILLDPNRENYRDIMNKLQEQTIAKKIGKFELGEFGFYVESMDAAPSRYCSYLQRTNWAKDRVLDPQQSLWMITFPSIAVLSLLFFTPPVILGFDGWILRKLLE